MISVTHGAFHSGFGKIPVPKCAQCNRIGTSFIVPLNAADFLYQAKQVCDYIRDQGFQYGDAPVNPAVNCDARLVSCDRMVGWALYRLGHIDQPKVQGLCVSGPGMTNWCIEHNFQRVDRVEELLPGDIVFTRLNRFGCPAHTFIHAGKGEQEGMYYRYDAGKIERIRSTQPSCEPIENFLYAYRPAAPRDPVTPNLSFLYDGVPFDQLEKKRGEDRRRRPLYPSGRVAAGMPRPPVPPAAGGLVDQLVVQPHQP